MAGVTGFKLALTGLTLVVASVTGIVLARAPVAEPGNTATISVTEMPAEGARTYALVAHGGPFTYDKDGAVFGNRERLLPLRDRGYYREYTVSTPGVQHRGIRRIVCGGQARTPDSCFYTADHYASFRRIVP